MSFEPTLYHGDFFELYKNIAPGTIDLILSDMPYNIFADDKQLAISRNDQPVDIQSLENALDYLTARNANILLFCNFELLIKLKQSFSRFQYRYHHVIIKSLAMPTHSSRPINNIEYIGVFARKGAKPTELYFNAHTGLTRAPYTKQNYNPDVSIRKISKKPTDANKTGKRHLTVALPMQSRCNLPRSERAGISHPFQKSEQLLRQLIRAYSAPGANVLDAFAGSGSTLTAAFREGRQSIGFEIDEKYFDEASTRLREVTRELAIFPADVF